jgi:hypothetical protein
MTYEYYSKVLYFKKVEEGELDHFSKRAEGNRKRRNIMRYWLEINIIRYYIFFI